MEPLNPISARIEKLPDGVDPNKILNLNVGILGHIDSGKTSLTKKLATIASTACFDKNPQSKERGITLDLGFSAFYVETPSFLKEKFPDNERLLNSEYLQITLVDCPGHASLIKTVIAGANIIDTVVLVIDIIKGIQAQTTECLVLSEILSEKLVVALNKIDLLGNNSEKELETKVNKLRLAFGYTKFGKDVAIVPVCADIKDISAQQSSDDDIKDINYYYNNQINLLILSIINSIDFNISSKIIPTKKNFLFSIDHCFNIKNKGTIVTGTILKGKVSVNDEILFPQICEKKIVKEMQMFKKSIHTALKGDRVGMLIKNLDHTKIERSLACSEGLVQNINGGIFLVKKINYYKSEIKSNLKYYVIIGNQAVMAKCLFFTFASSSNNNSLILFNEYDTSSIHRTNVNMKNFYTSSLFSYSDCLAQSDDYSFAYLRFDNKILIPSDMIALGSKIDIDVSQKSNRLAFSGKMIDEINDSTASKLKIIRMKSKEGKILRIVEDNTAIVTSLFKKDSNTDDFLGKTVEVAQSNGKVLGVIHSRFGQSGKVKVEFNVNIRDLKLTDNDGNEIDYSSFKIILEYQKQVKLF